MNRRRTIPFQSKSTVSSKLPPNWSVISAENDQAASLHEPDKPRITLNEAWLKWRRPQLLQEGRRYATMVDYTTALNHWSRWCELRGLTKAQTSPKQPSVVLKLTPQKYGEFQSTPSVLQTEGLTSTELISEFAIEEIDSQMLAEFRGWLSEPQTEASQGGCKTKSRSKLTINRVLRNIRSILLAAESVGAIGGAPSLRRLPAAKNRRKIYLPVDHVEAIYRAARVADWPKVDEYKRPLPHPTATYWRAAIVLWWFYGFRTQELIRYEADHASLRWSQISFDSTSPTSDQQNPHGWLWYVPQKQAAIKPEPLVLPLSAIVKQHLLSIRPRSGDGKSAVFPFPHWKKEFYGTWAAIIEASGVRPRGIVGEAEDQYLIKHLRKSCATYHNLHNRGIAPFILGHASREDSATAMTDGHYDNAEIALVRHFASVPVPAAFSSASVLSGQLELF